MLLVQHAMYPYRQPVFEELHRRVDLTVLFCIEAKPFRRWDNQHVFRRSAFKASVLPHVQLGPLVINPTLLRHIKHGRYDALVFGGIDFITLPQVVMLLAAAKAMRLPVIACEEFFPTGWYVRQRPIISRIAIGARRLAYSQCDAFVTWNLKARAFLVRCGVPEQRIFSGPHHYPRYTGLSDSAVKDPFPGRPMILSVSYLLERKGLDNLIRAFRRLPHDGVLVIAGAGEEEMRLRAEASGDERIHLVGHLNEDEKDVYLRHAHTFVLPTLWDPWGLVANEAMYYGLPVIVTDAAGCADYLIDGNGMVVPAGDDDALFEALRFLLDHPAAREAMGARSQIVVERCSLEAMVQPVLDAVALAVSGDFDHPAGSSSTK